LNAPPQMLDANGGMPQFVEQALADFRRAGQGLLQSGNDAMRATADWFFEDALRKAEKISSGGTVTLPRVKIALGDLAEFAGGGQIKKETVLGKCGSQVRGALTVGVRIKVMLGATPASFVADFTGKADLRIKLKDQDNGPYRAAATVAEKDFILAGQLSGGGRVNAIPTVDKGFAHLDAFVEGGVYGSFGWNYVRGWDDSISWGLYFRSVAEAYLGPKSSPNAVGGRAEYRTSYQISGEHAPAFE
jgi:hypothetical protein